ncbi:TolC family protein [Alienimonas sp. DA493]|uniref:TolC family protein n=1 Tax=Alienimonas sp. DA493 TaxID=3373605 RepID=UPI003753F8EE
MRPPFRGRRACGFALLAATVCLPIGCGKAFWRQNADAEAYGLAWEKSQDPRWAPPRLDIIPDPRSRFFDPNHPDCEPVPPDDPAANRFMDRMGDFGRIKGDDDWHETYGYTPFIENPLWLERFGLTRAGLNAAWAAHHGDADAEGGVRQAGFQTGLIDPEETAPLRRPVPPDEAGRGPERFRAGDVDATVVPDEGEFAGLEPTEDVGGSDLDSGNPFLPAVHNLTLPGAIELAYIHNREYQTILEDVYLAALALSFERFRFDVRFLGLGGNPPGVNFQDEYLRRPLADTSTVTSNFGISRLLPAGGQWAIELTNNTLYVFGGGADSASASLISYSLVQPLLRGAGRKVTLEALTQSERNLLYAIRELARFRKTFFADAATAGPGGGYLGLLTQVQTINNLRDNIRRTEQLLQLRRELDRQRPPKFPVPLARLPDDVIDDVPADILARPGSRFAEPGEEVPTVEERLRAGEPVQINIPFTGPLEGVARYNPSLGLLEVVDGITEAEEQALLELSDDPLFRDAAAEAIAQIRTDPVTLAASQLESNLVNLITRLRQAEASLQDNLDSYKLYLGLPPDMVVTLDESFLQPFQLIDADLIANEQVVEEFVAEWAALNLIGSDEETLAAAEAIPAEAIAEVVRGLAELNERTRAVVRDLLETDLENVRSFEEQRLSELDELQQARFSRDLDRDELTLNTLLRGLDRRTTQLTEVLAELNAPNVTARTKARAADLVGTLREDLLRDARGAEVVQTGLRVEQLALNPFDLPLEAAVQLALENRLDLMNQRAAVTDARRQLELAANALQGVLNLTANGNFRTQPLFNADGSTNPLDFRLDDSDFNVGVEFDTPLDRVQERNAYRAALIDYQRARRDFIAAEDAVRADVRTAWRQLAVLKQNFETTRQAVRIAAVQFDNAVERQFGPGGGGSQFDLLNALSSLLGSSNDLISTYVNYESARVAIHRDMGLMVVGPEGLWRDEFYLQENLRVLTPGEDAPEPAEPELVPSE